jgi:hypothetical protein
MLASCGSSKCRCFFVVVERFLDDKYEPMEKFGVGGVYQSTGGVLSLRCCNFPMKYYCQDMSQCGDGRSAKGLLYR